MKGFLLISGCPRSGTSVCTDIHRNLYGEDRLLGSEFPQEGNKNRRQEMLSKEENEQRKKLLEYNASKMPKRDNKDFKDLNPNGFLEHPFTVKGIQYHPMFKDDLKAVLDDYKIVKVVSQGLLKSDPIYISKIVFMLRHPRAVAKSQERLEREIKIGENAEHDVYKDVKIHSPEMFINVSIMAMRFFKNNPDIPVKIIQYEDLMENPDSIIQSIYDFNGIDGDLKAAKGIVNKKYDRSKHEDIENKMWPDAEYVYAAMLKLQKLFDAGKSIDKLIDTTIEYMSQPEREINKKQARWFCGRAKRQVGSYECERCMVDLNFRKNYKKYSEDKIIHNVNHWADEPCAFECGMDVERSNYIDVEDSIYMNFWRRNEALDLDKLRA